MVDPYRIGRALHTKMHQVTEFIYVGNRSAAEDLKLLNSEGIVKILQLLDFYIPKEDSGEFQVHYIQMEDSESQSLALVLPEALRFIHTAVTNRQKILVHCNAGVSRSGSVVIAYLMARMRVGFKEALALVQDRRACIDPNPGFAKQLMELDTSYLSSLIN